MNSLKGIDLQVNGWNGVNFSDASLARTEVDHVADVLANLGTEQFLPTVITSSMEVYQHALPILAEASEQNPHVIGIHLEGPFISPEDGAVGAHPKSSVQKPSIDRFKQLQELAGGHIRLLTLAPEQPGALELIEYLSENNVVVSVGHTQANAQQIQDACSAGASLATHVGNGISNDLNRTDNTIWSILASPLTVMLITDGFHLPPDFVRTVYAAKGPEKIIITSDAAPVAGLAPGEYDIFGTRVRLTEEGCVRNLNAPTLAGSAATMADCAAWLQTVLPITDQQLRQMTVDNPLGMLGLSAGAVTGE